MIQDMRVCPECGKASLYLCRGVKSGVTVPAGTATSTWFELLPGLGTTTSYPEFDVIVCESCGLTRFYAAEEACRRLGTSATAARWHKVE